MTPPRRSKLTGLAVTSILFLTACTAAPAAELPPDPVLVVEEAPESVTEPEPEVVEAEVVEDEPEIAETYDPSDFEQVVPQLAVTTWDSLSSFDGWTEEQPEWWQDNTILWIGRVVEGEEERREQEIQIHPDGTLDFWHWGEFVFETRSIEYEDVNPDNSSVTFNADGTISNSRYVTWLLGDDTFLLTLTDADGNSREFMNHNLLN